MVHVHKGAPAFVQEGDFGPMVKAPPDSPSYTESKADAEVDEIDTFTPGGPWVLPRGRHTYRQSNVTLYNDCSHVERH